MSEPTRDALRATGTTMPDTVSELLDILDEFNEWLSYKLTAFVVFSDESVSIHVRDLMLWDDSEELSLELLKKRWEEGPQCPTP